jgi:hypothetical protein
MADDQAGRRSGDRNIASLEDGWAAELWRTAYGVSRVPLRRVAELLDCPGDQAEEKHDC